MNCRDVSFRQWLGELGVRFTADARGWWDWYSLGFSPHEALEARRITRPESESARALPTNTEC
jgi:predicted secreted hydrolase